MPNSTGTTRATTPLVDIAIEKHNRDQDTTSGLTMDSIAYAIRSELRQGMEQQQRSLSEKTRGTLKEGLAPICVRTEDVENKVTEGIQTTLDDIQELTEGQEKLEKVLSQTIAGTELLQHRILALEKKLAEFQREAGPCTLPAPVTRTCLQHRTGIPQVPLNFASCSLALSEVGFFSSLEERSTNPTSNGTVVIPTTTSATWSSSGRTTPMTEKQKCRRCTQGPSWHGGHNRADPSCTLHGSTVRNGGEALAYLRSHHARSTGTTTRSSGSTLTTSTTRSPAAPTARSPGSTPATPTTRKAPKQKRAKQHPKGPQRSQPLGSPASSKGGSSTDSSAEEETRLPRGEQPTPPMSSGTRKEDPLQGQAQPVSPGTWGPQDEEFEREAWSSILDYVPNNTNPPQPPPRNPEATRRDQSSQGGKPEHRTSATKPALTTGMFRGMSPLEAGAARATPPVTTQPVEHKGDTCYQEATLQRSGCEGEEILTHQLPTKPIRETDTNDAYYPKAPTTTFEAQQPTAQLVPPGGAAPRNWGLHPDQDVFEDTPATDKKRETHEHAQNDSGELPGTTQPVDEEPDWSRDSPEASEEETENDASSQRTPDLTCSSWGATRPAEPEGPPPPRAQRRGETRKERNRRDREEWRQRRRIRRRLGLEPGYFYPSGAEKWR